MIHFVRVPPHPADEPLLAFLFYRPCKVGPRQIVALPRARLCLRAAPVPPMGGFDASPKRAGPRWLRGDRLALGPAYVAAALSRQHGYGRSCALPFWTAPVSRVDALARQGGGNFQRGYLDRVAEAARRARPGRTRPPARGRRAGSTGFA